LFGDVIQDVANVGINDIGVYWLADESRGTVLLTLTGLMSAGTNLDWVLARAQ